MIFIIPSYYFVTHWSCCEVEMDTVLPHRLRYIFSCFDIYYIRPIGFFILLKWWSFNGRNWRGNKKSNYVSQKVTFGLANFAISRSARTYLKTYNGGELSGAVGCLPSCKTGNLYKKSHSRLETEDEIISKCNLVVHLLVPIESWSYWHWVL